jgi:hypothetical protein
MHIVLDRIDNIHQQMRDRKIVADNSYKRHTVDIYVHMNHMAMSQYFIFIRLNRNSSNQIN